MKLTIYGTQSSKYEYLKHSITKTAESAGISLELEEVKDVQDFIRNDIKSVPAIKLKKSYIIDAEGSPSFEAFVNKVLRRIIEEAKFGKMQKVIVPTDFSSTSKNALNYVLEALHRIPTLFKLLYVYHPVPDVTGISMVTELPDIQRKSLKKLSSEYQMELDETGSLNLIEPLFEIGLASEKIIEVATKEKADLIVMGTSGKGDTFKNLFGSVSLEISKNDKIPLLLIPPSNKRNVVNKILFLTNNPNIEQNAFSKLVDFAKKFEAKILILHVAEKGDEPYSFDWFRRAYNKIDTQVILNDEEQLEMLIGEYAKAHDIDMIAMVHGIRGFVASLFHRSVSKMMAIHTDFPLMILPPKKVKP